MARCIDIEWTVLNMPLLNNHASVTLRHKSGGGIFPFRKTIGLMLRILHRVECSKEFRTPTNKMGKLVCDHTRDKEGHVDLYVIK